SGVGKRPALPWQVRSTIITRAVFPRELKPQLVESGGRETGVELRADCIGKIPFDRIRAAPPRFHVERAIRLPRPCEVIAGREQILRTGVPVDLSQSGNRVVVARNGAAFVWIAKFRGKEVRQCGINTS